jgi:hypothetical protein
MKESYNIQIMEMIENIIWILTGFIPTLVTMEVGWRMGRTKRAKATTGSKYIAMEQVGVQ